ncbi:MAG: glycosyltransferase [bacterium]|nr:glycosyltransferase [bacterium]
MVRSPLTSIALFVYNRPAHLQRALEALAKCRRLDECALTIYCDAPKHADHAESVEAARQVAREWGERLKATVIERETNYGLSRSIVTGVTALCQQYGRVIVLEDDLLVSPDFLDYMLGALDAYADSADVVQVSGYMFPLDPPPADSVFLLPLTTTWGWATWARAWQQFDWNAPGAGDYFANPANRHRFDLDGAYGYTAMLEDRLMGKNDSWGILWWYSVFRSGGLVVYPPHTLVQNVGFDGSGTHWNTASTDPVPFATSHTQAQSAGFKFPPASEVDLATFERVKAHLRPAGAALPNAKSPSILNRVRGKVGQLLKGMSVV